MSKEAMKLALDDLMAEYCMERTSFAKRVDEIFKQALAAPVQEPVAMRMPKVGDRVVCIEDESFGTVVYLTAGGSPEIKFDDGSHGTYMLREFAELFGYTSPAQEFICSTGLCHYKPAAPVQPVASLKEADVLMIAEAHGIDPNTKGLYGFYIDCISTTPPAAPVQEPVAHINQNGVIHEAGYEWGPTNTLTPLYPAPPAAHRQWVGLTDEQKLDVVTDYFDHVDGDWAVKKASQLLDAYESKLREKNA
jgi:hypothetical protein